MTQFQEAFIFLADGPEPAEPTHREGALTHTALVPVADAETAAAVAAELQQRDGLDLVELYGGFGPTAAATVLEATGGRVPVGVVGVEEESPVNDRAVIFAALGADPARDRHTYEHTGGRITFVAVPDPGAVPAAADQLVREGVERLDVCGGLGATSAAAAIEAVGDRAEVRAVMFGFESLPGAASYRARFEEAIAT
jgi:Family of unknown function (DUF6506)